MGSCQDTTSTLPKTLHCNLLVITLQSSQRQARQQGEQLNLLSDVKASAARNPPRKSFSGKCSCHWCLGEPLRLLCKYPMSFRKVRGTAPESCLSCMVGRGRTSWKAVIWRPLWPVCKDAGAKGSYNYTGPLNPHCIPPLQSTGFQNPMEWAISL